MAHDERARHLFLLDVFAASVFVNGQSTSDALVAAARIAVHGFGATIHTCVGGGHGFGNHIVHDVATGAAHQDFTGRKAVTLHAFQGSFHIIRNSFQNEFQLFERGLRGKIVYLAGI